MIECYGPLSVRFFLCLTSPVLSRQVIMEVHRHLLVFKSSSSNKPTGATEPSDRNTVTTPSEQSIAIDGTSPQSQFSSRTNEEGDRRPEANDIYAECSNKNATDEGSAVRKPAPKRALPPRQRKQTSKKTTQIRGLRIDSWATFPMPACSRGIHPPKVSLKGSGACIEKPTYKHVFTRAASERACKLQKSQTQLALLEKPVPKHFFTIAATQGYSNGNGSTEHSPCRT